MRLIRIIKFSSELPAKQTEALIRWHGTKRKFKSFKLCKTRTDDVVAVVLPESVLHRELKDILTMKAMVNVSSISFPGV